MARTVIYSTRKGITQITTRTGKVVHNSTSAHGYPACGKYIHRQGNGGGIYYTDEEANCPRCKKVAE